MSRLLLPDVQRAPVERLRLGIAALLAIEVGQPVQGEGDPGMVMPQRLFTYGEGALVERLRLVVLGALAQVVRRPGQQRGQFQAVRLRCGTRRDAEYMRQEAAACFP